MKKDILELLKNGKALDFIEISAALGLSRSYDEELAQALQELINSCDIALTNSKRYILFDKSEKNQGFVKGQFMDTKGDAAFVRVPNMSDDIYIHGSKTKGALNGDTVLICITRPKRGEYKAEGQVVRIIERKINDKVGEIFHYEGKLMVNLDDKKINKLIYLKETEETKRLVDGDKVLISLHDAIIGKEIVNATLIKRLGHINDPGIDILSVIAEHGIEVEFNNEVQEELKKIPVEVKEEDYHERRDLRKELIYTIDGDDTKDIDDAISVKKLANGNYELGVHIADVSHYIKENSALDMTARKRGTSTYLVDRVIPMYPHQLSNGICSLNPNVDRLTISCVMEISPFFKVVNYDIFPSVIHSNIQMTYNHVNEVIEDGIIPSGYEKFADNLKLAQELAHLIREARTKRGAIDFDTNEAKILVDEEGNPIDVVLRNRGEGEKLIEDFMVMANEVVASHFFYMDLPSLYRIHGMAEEDKLRKFLHVLSALGITLHTDVKKMNAKVVQKIVEELKHYPEFRVLATKLLSCMNKAIYSPENIGHFALASKVYTHFTSPIRRYPDTMIHRMLHEYFFSPTGITKDKIEHFKEILSDIGLHSSEMERNSDDCERDVDKMKMAEYMENHLEEEYHGMISGVMDNGFYVQLDNLIEGFVSKDSFNNSYHFDGEVEIAKVGNKKFKLGQEIIIRVVRSSKLDSQIDFCYVGDVNEKEKVKKKN